MERGDTELPQKPSGSCRALKGVSGEPTRRCETNALTYDQQGNSTNDKVTEYEIVNLNETIMLC